MIVHARYQLVKFCLGLYRAGRCHPCTSELRAGSGFSRCQFEKRLTYRQARLGLDALCAQDFQPTIYALYLLLQVATVTQHRRWDRKES